MMRRLRKINLLLFLMLLLQLMGLLGSDSVEATTPFIYRPYYGDFPGWTAIFDHSYPDYGINNVLVKFSGEQWTNPPYDLYYNCSGLGLCYDGHSGWDFPLSFKPVVASASGTVEYAGWDGADHEAGFGLHVIVNHNNNYKTLYGHLSMVRYFAGANVGQWQIGTSGTTGNSTGPHLHFEVQVWYNNAWRRTDPYGWSGGYSDPWQVEPLGRGAPSEWLWVANPLQPAPTYSGDYYVDDGDATFSKGCSGYPNCPYWYSVSGYGYSNDLLWTYANGTTADYWAQWNSPNIPSTGQYEIEVFIPSYESYNLSHAARYQIQAKNGSFTVVVDQHDATGQWVSLGRYEFYQGTSGYVKVTDAAYVGGYTDPYTKKLVVDVIRWRKTH